MVNLKDIQDARVIIQESLIKTPLTYSSTLSSSLDCSVHLKLENLQLTGAYKIRGALNKMFKLDSSEKKRGVIAASAGNHSQGVALAAKMLGIKATIIMPKTTPLSKIQGTKSYGAEVILYGNNFDAALKHSLKLQKELNAIFIHPFDDNDIISGQGTIGLEIFESLKDLDILISPIGGGGLISGVSIALKSLNPKIKIIGVCPETMPTMKTSIDSGKRIDQIPISNIAEGMSVRSVGKITFDIVKEYVDEIVTVNDMEISHAIYKLLSSEKTLAEGAGASSVAALMSGKIKGFKGKKVACILSGGNLDINFLSKVLDMGMQQEGSKAAIQLHLPDTPGSLANLLELIGSTGANVLKIEHVRKTKDKISGNAIVNIVVETRGHKHINELVNKIEENKIEVCLLD